MASIINKKIDQYGTFQEQQKQAENVKDIKQMGEENKLMGKEEKLTRTFIEKEKENKKKNKLISMKTF